MVTISIDPVIFSIGHFMLRWYSLIVLSAICVGVWLTAREGGRKGFNREDIYDGALWVILGGLLTSTALSLFVLPTLALRLGRFGRFGAPGE